MIKSKWFSLLFRLLVSVLAIGGILYSVRNEIAEALVILRTEVIWSWFMAAIVVYFLAHTVLAIRLSYVFKVQHVHMTFREVLYLSFLGLFFNLFLPSAVGGDVVKMYYAYQHSGKKLASTTSVVLDRLMGFVALILMAMIALGFLSNEINDPRVNRLVYIFLGIMLFSMFFLGSKRFARIFKFGTVVIPPKLKKKLSDIYHALYQYKAHKETLFITIALSFFGQALFILIHYLVAESLHIDINVWLFFLFVPLIAIVSMAPSIGGLGVREAGVIFFFKQYMAPERAIAFSILLDLLLYGFSVGTGVVYALKGGLKAKVMHEMEVLEQ